MGDVKWDLVVFSLEFHELPNMILNRSTSQKHDMYWMYHEHNWHKTIKHDVRHYYKIRDMGTFYTDAWIYGAWFFRGIQKGPGNSVQRNGLVAGRRSSDTVREGPSWVDSMDRFLIVGYQVGKTVQQ